MLRAEYLSDFITIRQRIDGCIVFLDESINEEVFLYELEYFLLLNHLLVVHVD